MKLKKSQASIEYIIIFGTLLFFLIMVVYFFMQEIPSEISLKRATDTVVKIAKSADTVYTIGPGAKRVIYVSIPEGARFVNITSFQDSVGGEITLRFNHKGKEIDIMAVTQSEIIEKSLFNNKQKRLYKLLFETTEQGLVNITSQ